MLEEEEGIESFTHEISINYEKHIGCCPRTKYGLDAIHVPDAVHISDAEENTDVSVYPNKLHT